MNDLDPAPSDGYRCRNESCGRTAEAGEAYCFACGLERSLFERDTRSGPVFAPGRIEAETEPRR